MGLHVAGPSIMVTSCRPNAAFFSLREIETIIAWGAARPRGFGVRIITDHADYPELAEVCKYDRLSLPWFLHVTQAETAMINNACGANHELDTVEAALALVLELERLVSNVIWPMHLRALRG